MMATLETKTERNRDCGTRQTQQKEPPDHLDGWNGVRCGFRCVIWMPGHKPRRGLCSRVCEVSIDKEYIREVVWHSVGKHMIVQIGRQFEMRAIESCIKTPTGNEWLIRWCTYYVRSFCRKRATNIFAVQRVRSFATQFCWPSSLRSFRPSLVIRAVIRAPQIQEPHSSGKAMSGVYVLRVVHWGVCSFPGACFGSDQGKRCWLLFFWYPFEAM